MQSVKPSVPIMAQIQATTQVMLGTAPPPRYLTSVQVSRRHLFLDFALGCRRLSFMVSSIITANDGG